MLDHAFRCYIFAARIACDSGPTCRLSDRIARFYVQLVVSSHRSNILHLSWVLGSLTKTPMFISKLPSFHLQTKIR